eukprot:gene15007-31854_t
MHCGVLTDCNHVMCTAVNVCRAYRKKFVCNLRLIINEKEFTLPFELIVIAKLSCDVILGLTTITQHGLLQAWLNATNTPTSDISNTRVMSHGSGDSGTPESFMWKHPHAIATTYHKEGKIKSTQATYAHKNASLNTLLKLEKQQLLDFEDDDDHVDEYWNRYDYYDTLVDNKRSIDESCQMCNTHINEKDSHLSNDTSIITTPTDEQPVDGPYLHGSEMFKHKITTILDKHRDRFKKTVDRNPAKVPPLILNVDKEKWCVSKHMGSPRMQSITKQLEIERFISD